MKSFHYTVKDKNGIHGRPAGTLVKLVKGVQSKCMILSGGKEADLKKLLAVMTLGVKQGQEVTVTIEGEDEAKVAEELQEFFTANL